MTLLLTRLIEAGYDARIDGDKLVVSQARADGRTDYVAVRADSPYDPSLIGAIAYSFARIKD